MFTYFTNHYYKYSSLLNNERKNKLKIYFVVEGCRLTPCVATSCGGVSSFV